MHFIYADNQPFSGRPFCASDYNSNVQISTHLDNWFILKFMQMQTDSIIERHQATKELTICERKISFWQRQPDFCIEEFANSVEKLQKIYEYQITYANAHGVKNFKQHQVKFINKKGTRIC